MGRSADSEKERPIRLPYINRTTLILTAAQAAAVTAMAAMVTLGGILGREMAPVATLATLPLSLIVVGTAAATVLAAWTMAHIGRGRGFALGALLGVGGSACAMASAHAGGFLLLCAAAALVGAAGAFAQQYRFAAAESAPQSAPQAVSVVLAGSLIGAVLGPELAARGEDWIAGARFAGTFAAVAACQTAAALLLLGLPDATAESGLPGTAAAAARGTGRRFSLGAVRTLIRGPGFALAVVCAAVGYGVMTLVMTAAPLAMHVVDGHSLADTAAVIRAHVLAMYVPSLFVGALLARFGSERVMLAGAAVLGITVAAGFAGRDVLHYGVAMVALGVGWNFLYVGGTTLLTVSHRPEQRYEAQAVNDLGVFGIAAATSLGAGVVMLAFGWNAVLWMSLPPTLLAAWLLWRRLA